ncbi:hypothetical protein [uncultured Dokdonia sp.]|uniref:hypothetical protein n=1 Tax=uncultured Dokdonia sp. TaxID=575653 RepID=UPI00260A0C6E|nr:hypothetical protein [uncultured Dokdonia sp.]
MYYLLEHDINKDDIYIPIEYDDGLNSISEGKKLRVDKIYFKGKNESDMISLTGPVISEKAKDFFSSLNLSYIDFIPHTFYHESNNKEIKIIMIIYLKNKFNFRKNEKKIK